MSDLRKHLESAKQEYQSLRYQGNLADDVLKSAKRSRSNVLLRLGAIAAVAAALLIFIRLRTSAPSTNSGPVQVAIQTPQTTDDDTYSDSSDSSENESQTEVASFGDLPAMSLPQGVSSGLDLAPSAPDFSFSAPSFTTLISADQNTENTSTTKESI